MLEKIELRTKLKAISMVDSEIEPSVVEKLNSFIKNKIVCTYVPLDNEININKYLTSQALLATTSIVDDEVRICIYQEPLEKNKYNVYQPADIKIIEKVDIFLVPGLGFDNKGTRLGKGKGIYDQLLSQYSESMYVGVTDKNHLLENIPHEGHDIRMHALITHDEFIEINI